jgi:hypothetical protein
MIRKDMKARKRTSKVRPNSFEIRLADALEWGIQNWVARSGKKWRISQAPWLEGPLGDDYIGAEFYERTARYDLRVRVDWSGPFKHPPRTLIYFVGRNVGQFDIPLSLSTVEMENELIQLRDPATNEVPCVGWLRRSAATGEAMLAGLYTTCELPAACGRFFKGVYPLPGGSATTIFRPKNRPDGSFALISDGRRFGKAGYYRIHRTDDGALRVKRVPMEETIHVFADSEGGLHARHAFAFRRARFLTLQYEITTPAPRVSTE